MSESKLGLEKEHRFDVTEKRCYGGGVIMTKFDSTTFTSIALSVLVTNKFVTMKGAFFGSFS